MKKILSKLVLGVAVIATLASCAVSSPLMVSSNARGEKVGEASYKIFFGIPPFKAEAGAIQAAKNGNITKIATVDQVVKGGLFTSTVTTIVTGE